MFDFDGFFDDLEIEDFAWIGGAVGCIEEEMNERIRIERQMEKELEGDDEVTNESPEELY
jgi:hypothetical protein